VEVTKPAEVAMEAVADKPVEVIVDEEAIGIVEAVASVKVAEKVVAADTAQNEEKSALPSPIRKPPWE
jgi:hypothetical protein